MQLKPACLVLVNACVFHPQLFQLKKKRGQVDAREEKAGLGRVFRLLFQGGEGGDLSYFERIGGQGLRGEPSPDHSLGRFGGEGLC